MTKKSYDDLGRARARKLYPSPIFCEHDGCGKPAERHHRDGDTHNNARSNVRFLCRKHHHEEDGRCQRPSYRMANSLARKGRKNPNSIANLTTQQQRGVHKSAIARAKMSAAQRGSKKAPWSPERRAAFSAMKREFYAQRKVADGLGQ